MNPILLRRWLSVWLLGSLLLGRSWADPTPQTLQWASPPPGTLLRLCQSYPLGATASSGLPVTFRVAAGPASITDGQVTVTNSGRVTLVAEQAGNDAWAAQRFALKFNKALVSLIPEAQIYLESGSVASVATHGDHALVGTGSTLKILDISSRSELRAIGSVALPGLAQSIVVAGNLAFVGAGGLAICDVSNPANPTLLGSVATPSWVTREVAVGGGRAVLAASTEGLWVIDVRNPRAPAVFSRKAEANWDVRSVQIAGDHAFVSATTSQIRVFDISVPDEPLEVTRFGTSGFEFALRDGVGYLADSGGTFTTWDVSNPRAVRRLGETQFQFYFHLLGFGPELSLGDGFAYIASASDGLELIDIGDPHFPVRLGIIDSPGLTAAVAAKGDALSLAGFCCLKLFHQVEKQPQTLAFALPPLVADSPLRIRLSATASSGLPVSFAIVAGPGIIEGDELVGTGPGIVTVRANQPGDAQFLPASVTRSVSFATAGTGMGWAVDPSLQLDQAVGGQIGSLVALPDGSIVAGGPGLATAEFDDQFVGQIVRLSPNGSVLDNPSSWKRAAQRLAMNAGLVQVDQTLNGDLLALTHTVVPELFGFRFFSMLFRFSEGDTEWRYETSFSKKVLMSPDPIGGVFVGGGNNEDIPGTAGNAWFLTLGRLGADFQTDPRFTLPSEYGPTGGGPSSINHIRPLPDGGALVAGAIMFPFYRGSEYWPNTAVFRIGPDGKLVWRHTLESPNWLTPASFVAELPGDRLVLFPSREVLDLNTGARLGTFPIPAEVIARTTTYFQEPDGRLILSGTFTNFAGITRRGLAAVWPDGALDFSFDPGQGTTNAFNAIAREADGSLLLGGAPGTFDGFAHRGLIRLVKRNPNVTPPTAPTFYAQATSAIAECAYPGEVHVVRSGLTSQTNRVRVQTLAETATAGADFVGVDAELVFRPGEGAKTVPLTVLGDQLPEGTESFRVLVNFEPGTSVLGATNFQVLIGDVDCGVTFFTNAVTWAESAGTVGAMFYPIENTPPGFTTRLRTRALSAGADRDVVPLDRSPVISINVPLQIRDNPEMDGPRQFVVEAYDSVTGKPVPGPPALTVTLTDDDTLAGPYRRLAGYPGSVVPVRDGWMVAGDFSTVNGHARPGLARYTLMGEFDASFDPPAELAGRFTAAAATADGGAMIGGNFDLIAGQTTAGVVRLNAAGSPVKSFAFRGSVNGTNCAAQNLAKAILVEPDGSSFMAGSFPAFFGCETAPRVLRVTADGEVLRSWPVPGHQAGSGFTLTGNGRGQRILQGNAGVFAVGEDGLTLLGEVDLGHGAPLAVLPGGGIVGLAGNTLVHYPPDGSPVADVSQFALEGDVWNGFQLHSLAIRTDGRLFVSGLLRSLQLSPGNLKLFSFVLEPSAMASGQTVNAQPVNNLRLTAAVTHPAGPIAALQVLAFQQTEPLWWRLDELGQPIADLEFQNAVADDVGRLHLALRGQAPEGYVVEVSEDLVNWTEWFRSSEINWGQSFVTPEPPADLAGRYFRLRF